MCGTVVTPSSACYLFVLQSCPDVRSHFCRHLRLKSCPPIFANSGQNSLPIREHSFFYLNICSVYSFVLTLYSVENLSYEWGWFPSLTHYNCKFFASIFFYCIFYFVFANRLCVLKFFYVMQCCRSKVPEIYNLNSEPGAAFL